MKKIRTICDIKETLNTLQKRSRERLLSISDINNSMLTLRNELSNRLKNSLLDRKYLKKISLCIGYDLPNAYKYRGEGTFAYITITKYGKIDITLHRSTCSKVPHGGYFKNMKVTYN